MGARTCQETLKAIQLVKGGMSMHKASLKMGLAYTTVFRACKALKDKAKKNSKK